MHLTYSFQDLPLLIDLGTQAGLVEGSAEINFDTDGEWSVAGIALNGYRMEMAGPVPVPVCRQSHEWLWLQILDQLENGEFKSDIASAVERELEDIASEDNRSMRRELERV